MVVKSVLGVACICLFLTIDRILVSEKATSDQHQDTISLYQMAIDGL